jgi:restriction system protein
VIQSAVYAAPGKNPANSHPNFLEVAWQDQPDMKEFPTVVFPMRTVAEISRDEYRNLAEGIQPMSKPATEATDQNEFVLEKYLEEFIVTNFDAIFKKELKIFQDTEGNRGQQFETDIGTIDILAVERHSDSFVVIELKKGRPSDQVIGQGSPLYGVG